jgi:hypothetical protein
VAGILLKVRAGAVIGVMSVKENAKIRNTARKYILLPLISANAIGLRG